MCSTWIVIGRITLICPSGDEEENLFIVPPDQSDPPHQYTVCYSKVQEVNGSMNEGKGCSQSRGIACQLFVSHCCPACQGAQTVSSERQSYSISLSPIDKTLTSRLSSVTRPPRGVIILLEVRPISITPRLLGSNPPLFFLASTRHFARLIVCTGTCIFQYLITYLIIIHYPAVLSLSYCSPSLRLLARTRCGGKSSPAFLRSRLLTHLIRLAIPT